MTAQEPTPLRIEEGRFSRLEAIEWWDQDRLRNSHVLLAGAGAIGNETLKNLAMLGVGQIVVVDMDMIEMSNLSRSVLFRAEDAGKSKAECAARSARQICPDIQVTPVHANLLAELGLGWFRWADIVIGALDNREARVFLNSACARTNRPWIDGGIEVLQGVVRGFAPPKTACYECTMSDVDWDLINRRRSCSLLARRAIQNRGVPTTPTSASVIGALQAQEFVKQLHGLPSLDGKGFVFEGRRHQSYLVDYPINPDCPWHEEAAPIVSEPGWDSDTPLGDIWAAAEQKLNGLDALELSRELVRELECAKCGRSRETFRPLDALDEQDALCPVCGEESAPRMMHSIHANSLDLKRTPAGIGLPRWDIIWGRNGERSIGFELAGDAALARASDARLEPVSATS